MLAGLGSGIPLDLLTLTTERLNALCQTVVPNGGMMAFYPSVWKLTESLNGVRLVGAELSVGPFFPTPPNPTHQLTDPNQPTSIIFS